MVVERASSPADVAVPADVVVRAERAVRAVPAESSGALPAEPASLLDTPICRRRALQVIGLTVAGGAVATFVAGCEPPPPYWAVLEVDPAALEPGVPAQLPFSGTKVDGTAAEGVLYVVKGADGSLVVYDPHCTHQRCAYDWDDGKDLFLCQCHDAAFDVEGAVRYGPPKLPLVRLPTRPVDGGIEVEVPGDIGHAPGEDG
jgi:Rieske Fe-S protein